MIQLLIDIRGERIEWRLRKLNVAHMARDRGIWAWSRSGWVVLDDEPMSDRAALSAALQAVLDRLGEREH